MTRRRQFEVAVIARASSISSTYSPGVSVTNLDDFKKHSELVGALHDQDVVISAVGSGEGMKSQRKLIDAAVDAGVRRFMSSERGFDNSVKGAQALCLPVFGAKGKVEECRG
ncbi:hypothetical protein LTR36_008963 [Oleoguttula mirabilis]|uniref:NmrA-like domain-containing protein n=1 Tax=Oleoguttula mirabilis TaxID=1507867 RepID=A0AAV9J784_9PEZI|nr:hypothetical protein LTR36_008963 [Oleoguttula mirabilis]